MDYPGKELEYFEKAKNFQKYVFLKIKKYIKDEILEVGAGLGGFCKNYIDNFKSIHLTEVDKKNFDELQTVFKDTGIKLDNKEIKNIDKKFNTVIYLNVLDHIKDDKNEINTALSKIKKDGHLIILVPAHQILYSKFDKEIGHYRRYEMNFFKQEFKNSKLKKLIYLDMFGYFLYFINKLFYKKEVYPSLSKILIWDKIFVPLTIVFDFVFNYRFGKNILCVLQKTED